LLAHIEKNFRKNQTWRVKLERYMRVTVFVAFRSDVPGIEVFGREDRLETTLGGSFLVGLLAQQLDAGRRRGRAGEEDLYIWNLCATGHR
jgi:hypothetical protein